MVDQCIKECIYFCNECDRIVFYGFDDRRKVFGICYEYISGINIYQSQVIN